MASSNLVLHCGAVHVSPEELKAYKAPEPRGRWYPLSHSRVLNIVSDTLNEAGYEIRRQQLGVMRDGSRFFGVMDLGNSLTDGVALAVGIRNSVDKSFPLGFAAGARTFVCDNLAMSAELLIRRKHTLYGERDFSRRIFEAVAKLESFQVQEVERIERLKNYELSEDRADALILRAYTKSIIGARDLPQVVREWREPQFEEFTERSGWSLMNCITTVLRDRAKRHPDKHAVATMRLHKLLEPSQN